MSELTINCPHCNQPILGDTDYAGQTLSCPSCSGEFVMPGDPAPSTPPAPKVLSGAPGGPPLLKRRGGYSHKHAADFHPDEQSRPAPPRRSRDHEPEEREAPAGGDIGGFGRLFADPVTGQREACDDMGPSMPMWFGLLFLIAIPGVILLVIRIEVGMFPPAKETLLMALNFAVYLFLYACFIWLFRMMSSQQGTFGEILFISGFAFLFLLIFGLISYFLLKQQIGAMISGGAFDAGNLLMYVPLIAACAFIMVIYGAFRDLCATPGSSAFWFTPFTIIAATLTFRGYLWVLDKIMTG